MSDTEVREETSHVDVDRGRRLELRQATELGNVARRWVDQLDDRTIDAERLAERISQVRQSLAQRGFRLVLGVVTPQQRCNLLAPVRPRLDDQECEQGQGLRAQRRGDRDTLGGSENDIPTQAKRERRHPSPLRFPA